MKSACGTGKSWTVVQLLKFLQSELPDLSSMKTALFVSGIGLQEQWKLDYYPNANCWGSGSDFGAKPVNQLTVGHLNGGSMNIFCMSKSSAEGLQNLQTPLDVLVLDESHHINESVGQKVATPVNLSKNSTMSKFF